MAGSGEIEIRRSEVAERFACVPSQINYVLETRFTPRRGYYVESRRGGGGYIRIVRAPVRRTPISYERVYEEIGSVISVRRAEGLLADLEEFGLLDRSRGALVRAALRHETAGLEPPWDELVRARLLKAMLLLLFHESR